MPTEYSDNRFQEIRNGIIRIGQLLANAFSAYRSWYDKNAATIEQYAHAFAELGVWYAAVDNLAKCQIVFTGDISSEMAQKLSQIDDVDTIVKQYYFDGEPPRIEEVIVRCKQSTQLMPYSKLLSEVFSAYSVEHFHLACIGLFSIVDGVLSDFTQISGTHYRKRITAIEEKMDNQLALDDMDKKTLCIHKTISSFEDSIFKDNYSFVNEPDELNRHWVMHGRSRRTYTKFDCLKILLWLDAIVFLSEKIEGKEVSNT